jgi:CubicO group peptidase (beta-lactamase class C family)
MRTLFLRTLILFSAILLFSCGESPTSGKMLLARNNADTFSVIRYSKRELQIISGLDSIFACRVKETCFNGCVLLAKRGRVIYKKAMGFSDHENKKMLDLNSSFQLSSTSKPFTATAVLILMERGKLSLNDSIQKFIPNFPYRGITVRMLLCHRSGLPNYMYFASDYFKDKDKLLSNQDIVDCMIREQPARDAAPNKKFEYSNTNYLLLALIIEKVSGEKYAAFMKKNLFDPVGMHRTFVLDRMNDTVRIERTKGYEGKGQKWEAAPVDMLDGVLGDKNIYSTIYDMFLFDRALYSGKLLKPGTLTEAYSGRSHEKAGKRNYGLGWRIVENENGWQGIYHNGWWHGYNSTFFRRPLDETVIVILCNHNNKSTYRIQDILQVLDNDSTATDLEKEE